MDMEYHPIADVFPLMQGQEFEGLCRSIARNGLREPIWLYEGKILDGRNRYRACRAAGVTPEYRQYSGPDALAFVISMNLDRRHLNESQRAVVAARLANQPEGRPTNNYANLRSYSQREAAQQLNVSPRAITSVKAIEREAPELIQRIEAGHLAVHAAEKEIKRQKTLRIREEIAAVGKSAAPANQWSVWRSDVATWTAPRQYDFIITDPPYPQEYLPLYETLARRAKEWLKPGGLLVVMCGQSYLDIIYQSMSRIIPYYWTACYLTPGPAAPLRQRAVNATWKPLLMFGKYSGKTFSDGFKSDGNDKNHHQWGQSISGLFSVVSGLCLPGQYILDPFCGAGTTGLAALMHGCLFHGIDVDDHNINLTKGRLLQWQKEKDQVKPACSADRE